MRKRIWVIGCPCSGKTTVASLLSKLFNIPLIELDDLYWGHNWTRADSVTFSSQVDKLTNQNSWIVTGDYDDSSKIIYQKVNTIIFLDVSFIIAFTRLIKRTFNNIITRKDLGHCNKESLKRLFSKDSMIIYLFKIHKKSRIKNLTLTRDVENTKIKSIVLYNRNIIEIIELLAIKLNKIYDN